MKTFQLSAEPRTDLGKKATKALRAEDKIPAVINGGRLVELNEKGEYEGKLEAGEKVVKINTDNKAIITTDITVTKDAVRKLIYTPEIFDIDLSLNGKIQKAVLKNIQFHPPFFTLTCLRLARTSPSLLRSPCISRATLSVLRPVVSWCST